jgi:hypothetical protein
VLGAGCGVGAALAPPASPIADRLIAPAIAPALIIFFRVMTITFFPYAAIERIVVVVPLKYS